MEERPPLETLLFVSFGILLIFFAINVEPQQQNGNVTRSSPSPAPSPHMPPPLSHPPPLHHLHSPPKSPNELYTNSQSNQHNGTHKKDGSNFNLGQKIGLVFAGIVAILQVGVAGFLAFKRRQLLKMQDR